MGQAQQDKLKVWKLKTISLVVATVLYSGSLYAQSASLKVNLPTQPLQTSIERIAEQGNVHIVYVSDLLQDKKAPALQGQYTIDRALEKLLQGTNLTVQKNGNVYTVIPKSQHLSQGLQNNNSEQQSTIEYVSTDNTPVQLPVINVSSEKETAKDWAYEQTRAVSVIDRSAIDTRPVLHIADILQDTPGVYTNVNRTDPGVSVNIRGVQDFGRVNMMIDGMRQNFVKSGHQQRNGQMYIDSEFIGNVVVEKGPRANVHGATALAGSADFKTLDFQDVILEGNDFGTRIRANTGIGDKYDGNVRLKGSIAVAGNLGAEDQLQLLYSRSYNKQGATRLGSRQDSFKYNPIAGQAEELTFLTGTGMKQESNLFKLKYNINDHQSLQFSYVDTEFNYSDVSSGNYGNLQPSWNLNGKNEAKNQNLSLDYKYNPNDLININAKIYSVKTTNDDYIYAKDTNGLGTLAWSSGLCDNYNNVSSSIKTMCDLGLDSSQKIKQKTRGLQLDNTSIFTFKNNNSIVKLNYGLEYFNDKAESQQDISLRDGVIYNDANNNMNPKGERDVTGLFGTLNYNYKRFTAEMGLRWDHYNLEGETIIGKTDIEYMDSETLLRRAYPYASEATIQRYIARGDLSNFRYQPRYEGNSYEDSLHVNRTWKKFLPSFSSSFNVAQGLDVFSSWGKSWRPPAITESLIKGSHSGSGGVIFPNYMLEPEYSKHYEIGFNFNKKGLFTSNDKFNSKISWYNTRIDNFMTMQTGVGLNDGGLSARSIRNSMFVQNKTPMRYKGLEFDINYDTGGYYSNLRYNHILSKDPIFCLAEYPQGAGTQIRDVNYQNGITNSLGTLSEQQYNDARHGYPTIQAYLESQVRCDMYTAFNSSVSVPSSRGTLTLGTRLFDEKLDMGVRISYSKAGGYAYKNGVYTSSLNGGWSEIISIEKDKSNPRWPSYTLYDFYASYKFNQNIMIHAVVENIRDTLYVQNFGDSLSNASFGPGRTFIAGLEFRF